MVYKKEYARHQHYYKRCKVNKEVYIQIWLKGFVGKDKYLASLGSARMAYKKLVKLKALEEQTKKIKPFLTKSYIEEINKKTKI